MIGAPCASSAQTKCTTLPRMRWKRTQMSAWMYSIMWPIVERRVRVGQRGRDEEGAGHEHRAEGGRDSRQPPRGLRRRQARPAGSRAGRRRSGRRPGSSRPVRRPDGRSTLGSTTTPARAPATARMRAAVRSASCWRAAAWGSAALASPGAPPPLFTRWPSMTRCRRRKTATSCAVRVSRRALWRCRSALKPARRRCSSAASRSAATARTAIAAQGDAARVVGGLARLGCGRVGQVVGEATQQRSGVETELARRAGAAIGQRHQQAPRRRRARSRGRAGAPPGRHCGRRCRCW